MDPPFPDRVAGPIEQDFMARYPFLDSAENRKKLSSGSNFRPVYVIIETVNICNNLCIICAYKDQERPKTLMSMDLFEKAVQDYSEMGGGFLSLTPVVGDIFMDKLLPERLHLLKRYPAIRELGMTTNAVMVKQYDDETLKPILDSFSRISVSVYGLDSDEYRQMTQRDTYIQMTEGLRRMACLYGKTLVLEFRLLKKRTHEEIENWLAHQVFPDWPADALQAKIRINTVMYEYANWGIYDERNHPLPLDAKWYEMEAKESQEQCMIPVLAFQVYSNGNVSFCSCDNYNDVPELALGSIQTASLIELINSEKASRLWNWDRYGTPKFCQNCSFRIPMKLLEINPSIVQDPHQLVSSG